MPSTAVAVVLSTNIVRSARPLVRTRCDLTAWDLVLLSDCYVQQGLIYPKPPIKFDDAVQRLRDSLSECLVHFYPLAGRLATDPETTVFVDCNDAGAQFVVAACHGISVADLTADGDVPGSVRSFFPLTGALNHDGHSLPLLAVQITELADGMFIGCSFNHSIADGESMWHFINCWSELCRGSRQISRPPLLDRAFLSKEPIRFIPSEEAIRVNKWPAHDLSSRVFHFSQKAMASLKAKANQQCKLEKGEISSFQALSALIWRAVTRARKAAAGQMTICLMAVGNRQRLDPPMSPESFGNYVTTACTRAPAGELMSRDLGSAARALLETVSSLTSEGARAYVEAWVEKPYLLSLKEPNPYLILLAGSPRFEIYGNDFSWGRPAGVLWGPAAKFDGKVLASQGCEGAGSVDLEVCLSPKTMSALALDEELKEALSLFDLEFGSRLIVMMKSLFAGLCAQECSNIIKRVFRQPSEFKKQYKELERVLEDLRPVLDKYSTNPELEALRCEIKKGREPLSKGAKVACWNILKQSDYSGRLQRQVKAIQDCKDTTILSGVLDINSKLPGGGEVAGIRSVAAPPPLSGEVFGIEKPLTELKGMLKRNQVVGVYGMVGCGKTTLVNVLCRNPEGLFHKIFYFRVSKSPDTLDILKRIWSLLLVGEVPTFKDVEDAVRQVAHGLSEQPIKYSGDVLIFLDDVWSKKDLKNLLFRTERLKTIFTSREIIKIKPDEGEIYSLPNLEEEAAKDLFYHVAGRPLPIYTSAAEQIIKRCGGLPLALDHIGGRLNGEPIEKWQVITNDLLNEGDIYKSEEKLLSCFSKSVDSLSPQLQECFLDLGSFPEDKGLPAASIIDMWVELYGLT
ncbi:putative acetyltransferase [Nymphaea thermarum]|nr:putative acetyltransferase [Nymphaea thermarum]